MIDLIDIKNSSYKPYISMMSRSISSSLRRLTDYDSFALVIYYDNIHDVLASHGEPEYDNDEVFNTMDQSIVIVIVRRRTSI